MPATMYANSVIVFGDSMSDIGIKWKTKAGRAALSLGQMSVSPSGRFSDCRNWTDFMIEEASGNTLVGADAKGTIAESTKHTGFAEQSRISCANAFNYVNYAEGGACGDTPASKAAFLGTFKAQVDTFEQELQSGDRWLGNTLFIVWFGANDLYTAGRKHNEMHLVAREVAYIQRNRLAAIHKVNAGTPGTPGAALGISKCRFIFVNLARALTATRYTNQLTQLESAMMSKLGLSRLQLDNRRALARGDLSDHPGQTPASGLWYAQQAQKEAARQGLTSGYFGSTARTLRNLENKVEEIQEFEKGVMMFNTKLSIEATQNGDAVAEIGSVISEESIRRLFEGNYGLMAGPMASKATQIGARDYDTATRHHVTAIDQVHPTDQMYKLIWGEIYEVIKRTGTTFGRLQGAQIPGGAVLAGLSGPSDGVKSKFSSVLAQIRAGV